MLNFCCQDWSVWEIVVQKKKKNKKTLEIMLIFVNFQWAVCTTAAVAVRAKIIIIIMMRK